MPHKNAGGNDDQVFAERNADPGDHQEQEYGEGAVDLQLSEDEVFHGPLLAAGDKSLF